MFEYLSFLSFISYSLGYLTAHFPPSLAVHSSKKDRPFLSSVVIRKGGHAILKYVELLCSMEGMG